jgi:hypothetical protein
MKNSDLTKTHCPVELVGGDAGYDPLALPEDRIKRARSYIAQIPGAISGQRGHDATFRVACILIHMFGLNYEEAMDLMYEYSERCEPEWSNDELIHKVEDALALLSDAEHSRSDRRCEPKNRAPKPAVVPPMKPRLGGIRPFTPADVQKLSQRRGIPAPGLQLAVKRGFLFSTNWCGFDCYGLRDRSRCLIELRRMDGRYFPAVPESDLRERKSHAVRHSSKRWPLGILEAGNFPVIALVEGIPDFIYAHYRVVLEDAKQRVAVVGMLSASPSIDEAALPHFIGKRVRIFPHLDEAGLAGAQRWQRQLQEAGAEFIDFYDLSGLVQQNGKPVNDLCDMTAVPQQQFNDDPSLKKLLP